MTCKNVKRSYFSKKIFFLRNSFKKPSQCCFLCHGKADPFYHCFVRSSFSLILIMFFLLLVECVKYIPGHKQRLYVNPDVVETPSTFLIIAKHYFYGKFTHQLSLLSHYHT